MISSASSQPAASARKPKVCIITFRNFLQEDRRAQKEVATLLRHGYAVDVVYCERGYGIPEERTQDPDLRVVAIPVRSRRSLKGRAGALVNLLFFQSWALPRYLWAALRSRADVYHCHNAQALPIGAVVALLRRVPYFYDCRELWREIEVAGSGASLGRLWGFMERLFIGKARGVFAVCDFHADYLAEAYGIPRPTVLHNSPPRWDLAPSDVLRKRYGIPADHMVVIHTGVLFEGVGIDRLVEAADRLDPGITVVVLGFFLRDAFKQSVLEAISRRKNIVFAEPVAPREMPSYLMSADVGVVLYLADYKANQSLPNKLFEYMMCGLAVVSNGYRDTRRVVEGSQAGFALEEVTPETLAGALNRLRREPALLARLKASAREAAVSVYSWEREAEKMLDAYDRAGLLAAAPGPGVHASSPSRP
jgi:glycosyltransferase involved in cell wall biosynthesis